VNADPIELQPGSPEWQRELTASKIAAVLGLSPWESRYSVWWRMRGALPAEPETKAQTRGHYLEDAVARWLADQYNFDDMRWGGCWRNRDRPWQVASPDRLAWTTGGEYVDAVVECKTAASWESWGPDGSDEIPAYYRAQVVWQCDTLGLDTAYVGVLLGNLEFRGYVIRPTPAEIDMVRAEAREFLDSIATDEVPDIDAHGATYTVIRALHPDIDRDQVLEVDEELAVEFVSAVTAARDAEEAKNLAVNRLADAMGAAHKATAWGRKIAHRQTNGRGSPYLKPAPTLPTPPQEDPDA
jgi:putative phage-type endonuclease